MSARKFWIMAVMVVAVGALASVPLFAQSADPIKVGSVLRLSAGAEDGIPARRGVELAVEEINKAGGINGRPLQVIFEDEKDSPTNAVNAVQKLINVDKVVALIGPITSGATLAAAPSANEAKIIMITPTATSPKVSGAGAYIYRGCSRIDKQAEALTDYIAKNYKPKTVGVLYSNEPYGKGCNDLFGQYFEKLGIKVVATESFMRGAKDFKAQLTKLKAANPDILFIPGYYQETAPAASQARQLGMNQRIIGVYGDIAPIYIELAGKAAEGHLVASEYHEEYDTPKNKAFKEAYYKLVQSIANEPVNIMFAALTYDATHMIAEGMKKYGPTPDGIKKYLDEVKDFDGVTGKLSFNEEHDVMKGDVALFEVVDGKYVRVK
ncbi:MAG: ABC transporter substrate-binding protein [Deltaproteobacteria bacterium]|nr:ABC transporter substrate-binding protein [Deltaproteobacteria bacterium]